MQNRFEALSHEEVSTRSVKPRVDCNVQLEDQQPKLSDALEFDHTVADNDTDSVEEVDGD